MPKGRHIDPDLLPMAQQVRRADAVGDEMAEGAGGSERPVEAAGGEPEPGQACPELVEGGEMLAKTSSAEKCWAWSSPGDRRLFAGELPGQRTAGLRCVPDQSIDPALSVPLPRSGRPQDADQGVGCDPYSLRIPTHPCTAAA